MDKEFENKTSSGVEMERHIGSHKHSEQISLILNQSLSDQHVLYIKTRNFHWNLVGKRFHTLHEFLEEQYKQLEIAIDETAERVRMVGGIPHASMAEFTQSATLEEAEGKLIDGDEAIALLLRDHEEIIWFLRENVEKVNGLNDPGTADFLTDLLKSHEKIAWMLRSHLV